MVVSDREAQNKTYSLFILVYWRAIYDVTGAAGRMNIAIIERGSIIVAKLDFIDKHFPLSFITYD